MEGSGQFLDLLGLHHQHLSLTVVFLQALSYELQTALQLGLGGLYLVLLDCKDLQLSLSDLVKLADEFGLPGIKELVLLMSSHMLDSIAAC